VPGETVGAAATRGAGRGAAVIAGKTEDVDLAGGARAEYRAGCGVGRRGGVLGARAGGGGGHLLGGGVPGETVGGAATRGAGRGAAVIAGKTEDVDLAGDARAEGPGRLGDRRRARG